jgi:sigma-E factor negative regulatory protein RseB
MGFFGLGCTLIAVLLAPTFARADDNSLLLLQRMAQAAKHLTYAGTFVYQSGNRMETSHIAHTWADGRDMEHIEVLDGSPREILRKGEETTCFLPDEKRLINETRQAKHRFPALLPAGLGSLPDYYLISRNGQGRVAGLDSQIVVIKPRDNLRYGYRLWMDGASGLLLKSTILGERGETLELFSFTQVNIGQPLERDALKPRFVGDDVQVQKITAKEIVPEDLGWVFHTAIPGFHRISAMKRQSSGGRPSSLHVLFSDGVASISTFIEPRNPASRAGGQALPVISSYGPINVYHRQMDGYLLVVMGEVPAAAVKLLGDGIEWKKK